MEQTFQSPIGPVTARASRHGLEEIILGKTSRKHAADTLTAEQKRAKQTLKLFGSALKKYFNNELDAFSSVPVAFSGTTFQRTVLKRLHQLPAGSVTTYGELADKAGHPGAARAVGTVCSSNRLPLVIPCHRVIGSSGKIGGYSGGLHRKRKLLRHEGVAWVKG